MRIISILASLSFFVILGCRDASKAPKIDVCIVDEGGGMACVLKDGTRKYLLPSETVNMWATTQEDMKHFMAWCYDVDDKIIESEMQKKIEELQ